MSVLTFLDRNVLWMAPPVMVVSAVLLVILIRNVIRSGSEAQIMSLPLVAQQTITFPEARRVVLSVEGPMFSGRFRGLDYRLSTDYGAAVESHRTWLRASSGGLTTARREVRAFNIPHPGRYVLRIENLGPPQEGDARHRLIFSRPRLGKVVAHIIGIVLSSGAFIVSLVFFLLRLKGEG